jgi:hypothetical protein
MNSLKVRDFSPKALITCFLPSGHKIVTIATFVSASEVIKGGCTLCILQFESSNLLTSEMESYSADNNL